MNFTMSRMSCVWPRQFCSSKMVSLLDKAASSSELWWVPRVRVALGKKAVASIRDGREADAVEIPLGFIQEAALIIRL